MSSNGLKIKVKGSTGGQAKNVTVAAVVTGGVANEVSGPPPKTGLQTDLSNAGFEVEGLSGNAKAEDVKVLGFVEGGIGLKQVKDTAGAKSGKGLEECYRMQSEPRGLCYIFNNKEFEGKEKRTGTDKDRDDMVKVFEKLKFKVKVFDNSEADVMEMRLKKLSEVDHTPYDCLTVVFLTHGREGEIQGSDNKWLSVSAITSYFKSHSCPTLANKPKLFFFQSCRGMKHQKGVKVQTDDDDGKDSNAGKEVVEVLVAPEADFFFGYATVPGTKALRNVETGSWYIQELAKTLDEYAHSEDLLGMMTTVKRRVNERQYECNDGSYLKQTAEMTSRLLKKLYFTFSDATT